MVASSLDLVNIFVEMLSIASTMRPSVWGNNIITVRYIAVHGSVGRPSSGREDVTRVKRTDVELRTGREGGGGRSGGDLTRYFLLPGHCSLHATGLLSMVLSKYLLLLWVWRTSQGAGIFYFIKDKSIYVYILLYSVVPNDMTWQKITRIKIFLKITPLIERAAE